LKTQIYQNHLNQISNKKKRIVANQLIPDVVDYTSSGKKKTFSNPTFNPQKVRHFNVRTKLEFEKEKRKSLPAPESQTTDPLINFTDVLIPSKSSHIIMSNKPKVSPTIDNQQILLDQNNPTSSNPFFQTPAPHKSYLIDLDGSSDVFSSSGSNKSSPNSSFIIFTPDGDE